MVIFGYACNCSWLWVVIRGCTKINSLCGQGWLWVVVHCYGWLCMFMSGYKRLYVVTFSYTCGYTRLWVVIHCDGWLYIVVCGYTWLCVIFGYLWLWVVIHGYCRL